MTTTSQFTDHATTLRFMLAGNSLTTLRSEKTGVRYTYKIRVSDDGKVFFVSLLTGPENTGDYSYIGVIRVGAKNAPILQFALTKASKLAADSLPVRGFRYALDNLVRKTMPANVEIWHEGRCGRCGRTLTVPESIASGFGPECVKRGQAQEAAEDRRVAEYKMQRDEEPHTPYIPATAK